MPAAAAIAALKTAGRCVTRTTRADAARRYGCQTALYVVDGRGVNLGRLRELAALALAAAPAPEPPAAAPAPEPLDPAGVVALLCRKFPISTPATYQPAVARLQARGAVINPVSVLREMNRPTLPGELTPPPAPEPHGAAAPELPTLPPVVPPAPAPFCLAQVGPQGQPAVPVRQGPGVTVAELRQDAAAGRPVSLATLSQAINRPAPTGSSLQGQPWDPGTPEARARIAEQGRRVSTLWPIAVAVRGAGLPLPGAWADDGPVLAGEWAVALALTVLSTDTVRAAASALAALPPITLAQDRALAACRAALAEPSRPCL